MKYQNSSSLTLDHRRHVLTILVAVLGIFMMVLALARQPAGEPMSRTNATLLPRKHSHFRHSHAHHHSATGPNDTPFFKGIVLDDDEGNYMAQKEFLRKQHESLVFGRRRRLQGVDQQSETVVNDETSNGDPPAPTSTSPTSEQVTNQILPAMMVAVASTVITCAILLYVTDLHDRCRHERYWQEQMSKRNESMTSVSGSGGRSGRRTGSGSGTGLDERGTGPMLPPLDPEPDVDHVCLPHPGQFSICRMSTMTASVFDLADLEEPNGSAAVVELSEANRVCSDLVDMVQTPEKDKPASYSDSESTASMVSNGKKYSSISPLTELSSDEESSEDGPEPIVSSLPSTPHLHGETIKDDFVTPKKMPKTPDSFDLSLDTPYDERDQDEQWRAGIGEERTGAADGTPLDASAELPKRRQLFPDGGIEMGDMAVLAAVTAVEAEAEEYVRDIYFVPTPCFQSEMGLQIVDASCSATHPTIARVNSSSPLAHRVFVGDFILKVNDREAEGWSAIDVLEGLACQTENPALSVDHMVKLTIISSHRDGISEGEAEMDPQQLKTKVCFTPVEV